MKMQIGKYIINSDSRNFWIEEEYEVTKGDTKGKLKVRNLTGYCWTFERCLQTFRERTLGESGATTLTELLEALQRLFEDMDTLNRVKVEADLDELKEMIG